MSQYSVKRQVPAAELNASPSNADPYKDLARPVYCILGIPIDAVSMADVIGNIESAVQNWASFTLSTPNLNFLIASRDDANFRKSLLDSDLCPADGMPIIWVSRLLGLPITRRIAGSDIFEALKKRPLGARPIRVFFFGSSEAVASAAAGTINAARSALTCTGWICPGYGSIEEMSTPEVLEQISSSRADFLVAALGAKKGQLWLSRNQTKLKIPVKAHLGATINFQAGTIKRAPRFMQKLGLEWGWRILEEPHLWKRYFKDGLAFLALMAFHVLPLHIDSRRSRTQQALVIDTRETKTGGMVLRLTGSATTENIQPAIDGFRNALRGNSPITLDLAGVTRVDARFLGLLLMLRKLLKSSGRALELVGNPRPVIRAFKLHGIDYLLTSQGKAA